MPKSRLVGSFGQFALLGGMLRQMTINLEVATQFFRKAFVELESPLGDTMGLYSQLDVGADGKAKLMEITTPEHVLQSRKNCRTWTPKGSTDFLPGEIGTAPIEFMGEQCSDAFVGTCLEKILPLNSDVWDFRGTPEGQNLFNMLVATIYSALGNSVANLIHYAGHPLITSSQNGGWWQTGGKTSAENWANFVDQQLGIGMKGHYTLIDELKAENNSNYTVDISGYYNTDGSFKDTEDVTAMFDEVLGQATGTLNTALERMRGEMDAYIRVDGETFKAYKRHLISIYSAIPESFYLMTEGERERGVLLYDNIPVIVDDSINIMNKYLGVVSRRCLVTVKGNLAIARQQGAIPGSINQAGLRVEQSVLLKDKGRVDMYAAFRLNSAIADVEMACSGEHTVTP